jgi:hypothetical protein
MSAGASSFIAGYLAGDVDEWIYIDIEDQHRDSIRFIHDCEKVIGKEITILKSHEYKNVEDAIREFGGFKNARNGFAPCTNWLKKRVRKEWEWEHRRDMITYVWGFDANEKHRADRLEEAMYSFEHEFPLIDRGLSKQDVHELLKRLGIKRPIMYDLGYPNNNCIGCVKGGMGYWNRIRKDFPDVFESRARLERELGVTMLKDKNGYIYLDELDPNRGNMNMEIMPECGISCYLASLEMKG